MASKKKATVSPSTPVPASGQGMDFSTLVATIGQVHAQSAVAVSRAVNTTLTLRNWVIGWYIREYEQQGTDRATYGEAIINRLADALAARGMRDLAPRTLRQCRQFYTVYPLIWQSASAKSIATQLAPPMWQALSATLLTAPDDVPDAAVAQATPQALAAPIEKLFTSLSFSHLAEAKNLRALTAIAAGGMTRNVNLFFLSYYLYCLRQLA